MYAFVDASPPWLAEHIQGFIRRHEPETTFVNDIRDIPEDAPYVFQYCSGQELNQHFALHNRTPKGLINAYPNSDALARKDHLAAVIDFWSTKRPDSILRSHCPDTVRLNLDYAEYVEDALMAADDLTLLSSLEENAEKPASEREWWILKPALVDCGAGIRLFSTIDELASNLELVEYDVDSDSESESGSDSDSGDCDNHVSSPVDEVSDTEQDDDETATPTRSISSSSPCSSPTTSISSRASSPVSSLSLATSISNLKLLDHEAKTEKPPRYTFVENGRIPSSEMRAFVAQRYLAHPSIIEGRKWHVRAYVLCVGRLRVFVYREMLALLAGEDYAPPWENPSLKASLTNTALQDVETVEEKRTMRNFWNELDEFSQEWKEGVFDQISGVVAELFRGAVNTMADRFIVLDKCFELFAVDFLVDRDGLAWLLEVNETPAFYDHPVTGPIALRLFERVIEIALAHANGVGEGISDGETVTAEETKRRDGMVQVLDETGNLAKSKITMIMPEE
ncbi:putative tubulin--tyrosine ligase PBY1 [Rhypophila decipiens]|uniref:Tubulin--tyrosine ligase PBY1 n=1 Tax=Rhypophila decipiens TaxID=261697 RepID=A0AAN6YCS0_9PEZI|nr:putative tubulin--tyrosine ligase PBY1 [Rhypophila decipiens]